MIAVNRDPAFWQVVASHPSVSPYVSFGRTVDWGFVESASVVPLASEHGGFLFFQADGLGRVYELHTLYLPEGWGREVAVEAKCAFDEIFAHGSQMIVTMEMQENRRSQPPLSFGWKPAGDFEMVNPLDQLGKTWFLTRDAWNNSPAKKRADRQCQ